jgi:CheY-like chemotaxis protein
MPDMDGFSFLAEKQQNPAWAGIPVIVLSAKELSSRDRDELREAQVAAVLEKGLHSNEALMQEIHRAIQRGVDQGPDGGQP